MGLIDNDYGAGAISSALKGLLEGMQQGDQYKLQKDTLDENKRFREMELNSRMKSEDEKRARDAALQTYNEKKDKADRAAKLFGEGYDISTLSPDATPTPETRFRPEYLEAKRKEKAAGNPLVKDDPFAADLRTKWLNDPITKDSRTLAASYGKIVNAAKNPSAAGDLSLIFSYMKILDPGSTVREGEFANAQNAAGVPDQIRNVYERVRTGERLNPNQRADFINQAKNLYKSQMGQQESLNKSFQGVAKRRGLKGEDIVLADMFDQGLLQEDPGMLKDGMLPEEPKQASVGESVVQGIKSLVGSKPEANFEPDVLDYAKKHNMSPQQALMIKKARGG